MLGSKPGWLLVLSGLVLVGIGAMSGSAAKPTAFRMVALSIGGAMVGLGILLQVIQQITRLTHHSGDTEEEPDA
jgi:hypothetical protein